MSKQLVLFEDAGFVDLLPLVFWRSVFELQVSRKIMMDRIAQCLSLPVTGVWTRDWIATVTAQRCGAPANQSVSKGTILANGRWLCDGPVKLPKAPRVGVIGDQVAFIVCDAELAKKLTSADLLDKERTDALLDGIERIEVSGKLIQYPWDILADLSRTLEGDWIAGDAAIETELDPKVMISDPKRVHIGERSRIHPTTVIDASGGPIFISHDVEICPYAVIDGPVCIGPGCRILPHSWLRGPSVIGPLCRVGGEIIHSVLNSYSNKQHTGFLGHAYVGSWVNIGAGATNSNLKNTYGKIRVPINGKLVESGLNFLGAIIGDHAKVGINSTIPTGAVIGLGASISTSRVAPKWVPSFGWVTDDGMKPGDPLRLLDVACAAMARRNIDMTDEEVELFLDLGSRVRTYESPGRSTTL